MIPRPADDIHLPFEQTARAVAVLAADYPQGARIARHRHRRAQLLYAIEGVMIIERAPDAGWCRPRAASGSTPAWSTRCA